VEECQGSIVEDEMDEFENDPDKPCTFKTGYACGGCTRGFWRLIRRAVTRAINRPTI